MRGLIIYTITDCVKYWDELRKVSIGFAWFCLIVLFTYRIGAFQDVNEKYLMDIKYMSPYLVISLEGIFGVIITSFLFIILNRIDCPDNSIFCSRDSSTNHSVENFIETISFIMSNKEYFIGFFTFMLGACFFNIFRLKTNEVYSPTHRSIADSIGACLSWIMKLCIPYFNNEKIVFYNSIIKGLAYIIIIFGVGIYLEFMVINKWGLNHYTRININERSNFFAVKEKEELLSIYKL